jgi:uncharacterized YccA/Bax inhibitor family protein
MTVDGAVNKSLILGAIMLATAALSWVMPNMLFLWGGLIGGLICVLVSSFRPQYSPTTAPLYAVFEGLFLGTISLVYGGIASGIVFQAFSLTIGLLFLMLFLYKAGVIKVTDKLRSGIMMATGAICLVYLLSMVLRLFGINMPYLHQGGMIGIGISLVIIGIASMNLLLDFDNFEKGAQYGAPKYMEWFSAMGLLVTLVWLYLEILRLLSRLSRD